MSELSCTLMSLLKDISKRPQMFESTPQAAHGLFEGLAIFLLHESLGLSIGDAIKEVLALIKRVTAHVCKPDTVPIMLCDESFPNRVSSFEAFRFHSQQFIELLEGRLP